jgi:hypothetical protein
MFVLGGPLGALIAPGGRVPVPVAFILGWWLLRFLVRLSVILAVVYLHMCEPAMRRRHRRLLRTIVYEYKLFQTLRWVRLTKMVICVALVMRPVWYLVFGLYIAPICAAVPLSLATTSFLFTLT